MLYFSIINFQLSASEARDKHTGHGLMMRFKMSHYSRLVRIMEEVFFFQYHA